MKLEQQVVSLELAKRLKELGVKQESLFWWGIGGDQCEDEWMILYSNDDSWSATDRFSAFTVAELGEMLPARIDYQNELTEEQKKWRIEKGDPMTDPAWLGDMKTSEPDDGESLWCCHYGEDGVSYIETEGDTEANARAKMLSYLLENNLTPSPEPNQ